MHNKKLLFYVTRHLNQNGTCNVSEDMWYLRIIVAYNGLAECTIKVFHCNGLVAAAIKLFSLLRKTISCYVPISIQFKMGVFVWSLKYLYSSDQEVFHNSSVILYIIHIIFLLWIKFRWVKTFWSKLKAKPQQREENYIDKRVCNWREIIF